MHEIKLTDGTSFSCKEEESIVEGALRNGVFLEHSCLTGRCSSCKFKVLTGETVTDSEELPLTVAEKEAGYILTCVRKPVSDVLLDAEDLSAYGLANAKTVPAKIQAITPVTPDILQVELRLPPTAQPDFLEGQYLNVLWKGMKRSYSIASSASAATIQLLVKNYKGGKMSAYWFEEAKLNDLLRLEIPNGTFFLRNHEDKEQLIFVATGTGIAPIKAILESPRQLEKLQGYKRVAVLWGMKYASELFWQPSADFVEFIPVLSREYETKKYVQDVLSELNLDFPKTVLYACGSDQMIHEAKARAVGQGLHPRDFYSDAFVASN